MRRILMLFLCFALLLLLWGCKSRQWKQNEENQEVTSISEESTVASTEAPADYIRETIVEELPEDMAVADANGINQNKTLPTNTSQQKEKKPKATDHTPKQEESLPSVTEEIINQKPEETIQPGQETEPAIPDHTEQTPLPDQDKDIFLPEDDTPIG